MEFKIYYEHGSLIDTLPKELYLLDSLRKLELRFLGISKLDSLHHMINLKDLDLSFNRLGKTFDCRILPKHLRYLYLQMNDIEIITNTGYLKNLQRVALCNNQINTKVEFYGIHKDSCVGCYPGYTPTYLINKGVICEGNRKNDPNRIE